MINSNFKVSIIIPVFNVEDYLEQCLQSAVNQDYDNKEIIIIDDGSTDLSGKIIDEFKSQYPFIQSVKTKNQGQSSARNLGLEMAVGDYVLFLDSDDWFEKYTVSLCLKTIINHSLDMVLFSGQAFFDGETDNKINSSKLYSRTAQLNKVLLSKNVFTEELRFNKYIVQPCMYMFNRVRFQELRFYSGIIYEDNLFTTQLLLQHSDAVAMCLPDILFHRRFRPQSTMTQNKQQRHIDGHLIVIDELIKMIPQNDTLERIALKQLITNLLFDMLHLLNPVYGWHIPLKLRLKILTTYFKYGLSPFKLKLFIKFMMPSSFSYWKKFKESYL
ncbi:MAG: glycosyltransferase family 2 protein [Methylotenera sp.]|uniref:glycosyltransferase family 2 protein n=1 Tax=Methylotenera sp. TaxID=2051956 RepID=UPI0017E6AE7E|nr:glycosyltransferase family 2 protein [Methylotenera sp.]NOU25198.1 glycosyltransferase family 2 protein [Methylotenera sp.]